MTIEADVECPNCGENYTFDVPESNYDTEETYCTVCDEEVAWRFRDGELDEATVKP
ncbi:hypothetical protein [Natronococcus wangiae]|uniref:hypothetical protein n=1 Tax=Natronococcus wangiae TaxID=3068275 RepID=UPI00273F569A|nr:hypothetical protein [Natronococcus sp. AD5]